MPEGDALHRAATRLQPLVGERIEASSPNPQGEATGVAKAVDGRVLERVEAVGKHLLLHFEGGVVLRSHLRMHGRWRVEPAGRPVAGRPWLVLRGEEWQAVQRRGPVLELGRGRTHRLGPDIMVSPPDLDGMLERFRAADQGRALGEALLDQTLVAGIGNMWLAELLWHARLSPWLPVGDATAEELAVAIAWGRDAMRASVAAPGRRRTRAVYRRAGRPCRRCGAPIRSRGLGEANRTAYWCDGCQRGP